MECQANIAGEFVDGKQEQLARRGREAKATVGVILINLFFYFVTSYFYVTVFFCPGSSNKENCVMMESGGAFRQDSWRVLCLLTGVH
jgi:hypothetical protein